MNVFHFLLLYRDNLEKQTLYAFVGEWSLAVTSCQKYLDGGYATPYVSPDASDETCAVFLTIFFK